MAKKVGYEVTATKPVCVDFPDGRVVSFRPGTRFEAHPTNASVRRLVKVQSVRTLGPFDAIPALPVKLGAPRQVTKVLNARDKVAQARKKALAKLAASKARPAPQKLDPIDLGALTQPSALDEPPADNQG